jgi:hypothetical protein
MQSAGSKRPHDHLDITGIYQTLNQGFSPQDQNALMNLFSMEIQNNDGEITHSTGSLEESDPQKKIAHHLDQIAALDAAINAIGMRWL